MASNYTEWYFQLFNRRTGRPISDSTGLYVVLTASTPTRATCYSDANGTSLTLPATLASGVGRFWLDSSTTSVDISVLAAGGQSYFIEGLTPSQHRVDVDPEKQEYQFIVDWNANTASGVAAATGFNLLAGMRIKDCWVHVTTATTCTAINVGISGTSAGFGTNVQSSVTGWQLLTPVVTSAETSLSYANYVKVTQMRGNLLCVYGAGGITTATTGIEKGYFARIAYPVTAATALVYAVAVTNSGGTGSGYIYLEYDLLPSQGN